MAQTMYGVVACYLELYEEGEVKHINGPTHPIPKGAVGVNILKNKKLI